MLLFKYLVNKEIFKMKLMIFLLTFIFKKCSPFFNVIQDSISVY